MRNVLGTAVGAVTAGVGSAVCCSGPIVAASIGVSGAGLASFLPYRPYFIAAAAVFLWIGFYLLDREERRACETDRSCADPRVRQRMKAVLWTSTALVFVFGTSARWLPWIL